MVYLFFNSYYYKSYIEYQFSEFLCSVIPTLILVFQIIPSLSVLYYHGLIDLSRNLTIKVIGHQWYWRYDYCDIEDLEFDSYIKDIGSLLPGEPRLLEVDNRCIIPCGVNVRFCVTSADVIHSWSIPNFCIKVDAISGILSTICYNFPVIGVFYGQCSEICGANHSFIPICIEITLLDNFKSWCLSFLS